MSASRRARHRPQHLYRRCGRYCAVRRLSLKQTLAALLRCRVVFKQGLFALILNVRDGGEKNRYCLIKIKMAMPDGPLAQDGPTECDLSKYFGRHKPFFILFFFWVRSLGRLSYSACVPVMFLARWVGEWSVDERNEADLWTGSALQEGRFTVSSFGMWSSLKKMHKRDIVPWQRVNANPSEGSVSQHFLMNCIYIFCVFLGGWGLRPAHRPLVFWAVLSILLLTGKRLFLLLWWKMDTCIHKDLSWCRCAVCQSHCFHSLTWTKRICAAVCARGRVCVCVAYLWEVIQHVYDVFNVYICIYLKKLQPASGKC